MGRDADVRTFHWYESDADALRIQAALLRESPGRSWLSVDDVVAIFCAGALVFTWLFGGFQ